MVWSVNSAWLNGLEPPTPGGHDPLAVALQSPVAHWVPSAWQPVRAKTPPLHHTGETAAVVPEEGHAEGRGILIVVEPLLATCQGLDPEAEGAGITQKQRSGSAASAQAVELPLPPQAPVVLGSQVQNLPSDVAVEVGGQTSEPFIGWPASQAHVPLEVNAGEARQTFPPGIEQAGTTEPPAAPIQIVSLLLLVTVSVRSGGAAEARDALNQKTNTTDTTDTIVHREIDRMACFFS